MSDRTLIEWADASWNPIRMRWLASTKPGHYCLRISPGCDHCYASRLQPRMFSGEPYAAADHNQLSIARALVDAGTIYLDERTLAQPLHWTKPRRVFVCSMTDIAGEWVPDEWLLQIWLTMALAAQHTFIVLTKRPTRLRDMLARLQHLPGGHNLFARDLWPLPNVWLGVTVESDRYAWRAKVLQEIPAAVRWVSAEPLLGPLPSLQLRHPHATLADTWVRDIDWVVCGGESGPGARPLHPDWARDLRDRCQAAGVGYFFKQWGEWAPVYDPPGYLRSEGAGSHGAVWENGGWSIFKRGARHGDVFRLGTHRAGRLLDGREHNAYPEPRAAVPA